MTEADIQIINKEEHQDEGVFRTENNIR
ncbi:hypothetical protein MTR67_044778 [Solanum verrucosum]|uniref:Uncharacterized protein n=1 Tax=Solanum verrucosum TaxID=315347 RepID=A0AAF0ZVK5_SOLVR|nr:hypothetical protein MTR67_044778 [Solanum verrucosum]